jgi:hypothetical protein
MVKRSYEKEKEFMFHSDFKKPKAVGSEFGDNKAVLSRMGSSIITKFIEVNKTKEGILRHKEEELDQHRKSKPQPYINPWKYSNHIIGEFSVNPADKVHSFKKEKKKKFLIEDPFYRPSDYGNYFEKDLKII